ncbi:MAG: mechanosensitive ion channel domain-containing protein [Candidatus Auribacterota bacterium]
MKKALFLIITAVMALALYGVCGAQSIVQHETAIQSVEDALNPGGGVSDFIQQVNTPENTTSESPHGILKEPDMLTSLLRVIESQLAYLVIFITVIILLTFLLQHLISLYVPDVRQKYYLHKIIWYACWSLLALTIVFIVFRRVGSLSTFMGLFFAGVIIALRDVLTSFAGWFYIVGIKGFRVGDRIKLDRFKGDVIDIGILRTSLMELNENEDREQATGRIITLPNSMMLIHPLINYTEGNEFIWNELSFMVTFDSNWKTAEQAILSIAKEEGESTIAQAQATIKKMSMKYLIRHGKLTPIVYVTVADSGIQLTLRYLTRVRQRRMTADQISRRVLDAVLAAPDVEFAYHTIRSYASVDIHGAERQNISPTENKTDIGKKETQ